MNSKKEVLGSTLNEGVIIGFSKDDPTAIDIKFYTEVLIEDQAQVKLDKFLS